MTEPNENIAPGRGTATRTSESDEGKASGRGIMSLEAVRRLAWTAIILFIMAIVFAFNRGPILAWLAANHTPLLVGILQAPLWLVAFLLIVLGLQCWLDIVEVDKTPFAIILHALGIMLCIGWWAVGVALSLRQRADIDVYGLMGGFILTCLFAWIMDRRQTTGKEAFPKLRDQIADFAVEYIASESYRKNKDKEDEIGRPAYVSGEAACNTVDIATALGGGFHVSFPLGRITRRTTHTGRNPGHIGADNRRQGETRLRYGRRPGLLRAPIPGRAIRVRGQYACRLGLQWFHPIRVRAVRHPIAAPVRHADHGRHARY